MNKKIITGLALGMCLILPGTTTAEIQFNGFASIRAVNADSEGSAEASGSWDEEVGLDFKGESLFALQARSDLGEGLSATVQLMAQGQDDFETEARWAYASYEINDNNTVNVGRLANPIFYQSEYQKVGFAHNFARLPRAVYSDFPFATVEGISLDSNYYIGDFYLTTKLLYGNWDGGIFFGALNQDLDLGLRDIISFRADLSQDWWRVFIGAFTTEMDGGGATGIDGVIEGQIDAATGALPVTAAEIAALKSASTWEGKDGLYAYAGFGIDHSDILFDFEYADYEVQDSVDAKNKAWYVSLGYRFRPDLVVTVHRESNTQDEEDDSFLGGISDPSLRAVGLGVQGALSTQEWDGEGVSVRYDFHSNATFKFDVFYGEDARPTVADYRVISAGVDLVF